MLKLNLVFRSEALALCTLRNISASRLWLLVTVAVWHILHLDLIYFQPVILYILQLSIKK